MKNKKRYILIISLSICMVLSLVLLSSYAWWMKKGGQSGSNYILGACINIEYTNELDANNEPISGLELSDEWPMSDAEGKERPGYTFTVKNTCENVSTLNYEIVLESIETPNPNAHMPEEYIRVRLDDNDIKTYSLLDDYPFDTKAEYTILDTKLIYRGTLTGTEPQTHTIRSWFSIDAPEETIGYQFNSRIKVYAGQGVEVPTEEPLICYAVDPTDGTLVKYNSECGKDVVIPDSYLGVPIRSIGSKAFYDNPKLFEGGVDSFDDENVLFALAISDTYIEASVTQNIDLLTKDDFWIVKYKDGEEVDAAIEDALANDEMIGEIKTMFNITDDDLKPACQANTAGCSDGSFSFIYGYDGDDIELIANMYSYDLAVAMGIDPKDLPSSFLADSIDFSIATNLVEIKDNAFVGYNPETLTLPSSLKIIGDGAFSSYTGVVDNATGKPVNTSDLDNINDPSEVTFKALNLPDGLEKIGNKAFYSYYGYGKTLTIPNSVTDIGDEAFMLFPGSGLVLGNSVENIGKSAFYYYENAVTLPDSLVTIGDTAFHNVDFDTPLVMPSSLKSVGASSFSNYTGPSVVLNDGLESIGSRAFENFSGSDESYYNMYQLYGDSWNDHMTCSEITLPSSLKTIGERAFYLYYGCNTTLAIPEGITDLNNGTFYWFVGNDISLPSTLKTVGNEVFAMHFGVNKKLIIPEGVTSVGSSAFSGFYGTGLSLPSTLTSIGSSAFNNFVGNENENLVIPEGVTVIEDFTFKNFNGKGIELPSTLTEIDQWAFYYYNGSAIDIPNGVTLLGRCGTDSYGNPVLTKVFNSMQNTITVHSQNLYDTRSDWTRYPNAVVLDN